MDSQEGREFMVNKVSIGGRLCRKEDNLSALTIF